MRIGGVVSILDLLESVIWDTSSGAQRQKLSEKI
jgi:hypothetical protein